MVVIVDLESWPRFFVKAVVGLGIGRAVDLAIDGAVLMEMDITVGFFRLFLW